ncbi:orf14 [Cryptophlebia peltastica nucleopolyhedrovirus]|uniref:Orf14 n=1 Tax=Cryptophlebia peltastica nucleopolyhedrovirus TaxID=2304025 RepID=A0A346RNN3_9ABAC|nr:orf14 [Cryptophlebia peltastica nucleopolyhedrovirus]AXS67680.1 orf14 [Cryptophlebia peltastica nucleopolyhedrovirus]
MTSIIVINLDRVDSYNEKLSFSQKIQKYCSSTHSVSILWTKYETNFARLGSFYTHVDKCYDDNFDIRPYNLLNKRYKELKGRMFYKTCPAVLVENEERLLRCYNYDINVDLKQYERLEDVYENIVRRVNEWHKTPRSLVNLCLNKLSGEITEGKKIMPVLELDTRLEAFISKCFLPKTLIDMLFINTISKTMLSPYFDNAVQTMVCTKCRKSTSRLGRSVYMRELYCTDECLGKCFVICNHLKDNTCEKCDVYCILKYGMSK